MIFSIWYVFTRTQARPMTSTHLNLVNVNLSVLLLNFLVRNFHSIKSRHCIPQIVGSHSCAFHVERLLCELGDLRLVHAFLLQRPQSSLLDGILSFVRVECECRVNPCRRGGR